MGSAKPPPEPRRPRRASRASKRVARPAFVQIPPEYERDDEFEDDDMERLLLEAARRRANRALSE